MDEDAVRRFLERAGKSAATSSFYWESGELEQMLDLLVDAVARLIAANNQALTESIKSNVLRDAKAPRGIGRW